jgi:pyruvate formate-lyase activating enzyme-like uncharacterized protein
VVNLRRLRHETKQPINASDFVNDNDLDPDMLTTSNYRTHQYHEIRKQWNSPHHSRETFIHTVSHAQETLTLSIMYELRIGATREQEELNPCSR